MRFAVVLAALSVSVLIAMIYQAVRQELNLGHMKTRMVEKSAEVKRKEQTIIEVRLKVKELKTTLASVNKKIDELKKKKSGFEKSDQELDQSLQACTTEKENNVKKNIEIAESMTDLKANYEKAKLTAEEQIQNLKQQVLDRDKAICAFADTSKEEARKLCGISGAPK